MKRISFIVCSVLLTVFSFGQNSAVTTSAINLREAPTIADNVLGIIPQGSEIEVKQCAGEWCEITFGDHTGYVSKKYVRATSPSQIKTTATATSPVHYYTNVNGNRVQAPTSYSSRPQGATAQCADGTYSFSRNHRGTCSHHGGVAKWL